MQQNYNYYFNESKTLFYYLLDDKYIKINLKIQFIVVIFNLNVFSRFPELSAAPCGLGC